MPDTNEQRGDKIFLSVRDVIRLTSEAVRRGPIEQRRAVEVERNSPLRAVSDSDDKNESQP